MIRRYLKQLLMAVPHVNFKTSKAYYVSSSLFIRFLSLANLIASNQACHLKEFQDIFTFRFGVLPFYFPTSSQPCSASSIVIKCVFRHAERSG